MVFISLDILSENLWIGHHALMYTQREHVATKGRINRDDKIGSEWVRQKGKEVTLGYDRWVRRLLGLPRKWSRIPIDMDKESPKHM